MRRFLPLLALSVVILVAWRVLGRAALHPLTVAVGAVEAEGPAHLWGLWTAASGLWSHGPFLRVADVNAPLGFRGDLIDPVHLLVFWPVWRLAGGGPEGATLAWNLLPLVTLALAAWGGWRLLGDHLGDPLVALFGAVACVAVPALLGAVQLGRTETLVGAWWVLHLAALLRALRGRGWAGAILSLLGIMYGGWVGAGLALGLDLVIVAARVRTRVQVVGALGFFGLVVLGTLPFLLTVMSVEPWWIARLAAPSAFAQGAPPLPLVALLPGVHEAVGWLVHEEPPSPGLVLLGVAVASGVALPRRAGGWLALGLAVWVLSLGVRVSVAGIEWWAPASALAWAIPQVGGVHSWSRLVVFAPAPLAMAAGIGLARLRSSRPSWGALALALATVGVVWEAVGTSVAARTFSVQPPAELSAALGVGPGPVLELTPPGRDGGRVSEDRALLWQRSHQRSTSSAPSPVVSEARQRSALLSSWATGRDPVHAPCAAWEPQRLRAAGFGVVCMWRQGWGRSGSQRQAEARALLGPPQHEGALFLAWRLPALLAPVGCAGGSSG